MEGIILIREIYKNELKGLLELYLHLHESDVSEMSEHLNRTWKTIVEDKNHHIIIKVVDDKTGHPSPHIRISNTSCFFSPLTRLKMLIWGGEPY